MGDTLARKALETFCDSWVAKLKVHTIAYTLAMKKTNRLLDTLGLQLNRGNIGACRLVEKEDETLGNTSPKLKTCKHCSRHWAG